jgi:hypothetical protein
LLKISFPKKLLETSGILNNLHKMLHRMTENICHGKKFLTFMQLCGNYEAGTHPFEELPLYHILHTHKMPKTKQKNDLQGSILHQETLLQSP